MRLNAPARSPISSVIAKLWPRAPRPEAQAGARRALRLETLEPRLLLSADAVVTDIVLGLEAGFSNVGDALQDFIDSDPVFRNYAPGILVEQSGGEGSHGSPQLRDLFKVKVDVASGTNDAEAHHGNAFDTLAERFEYLDDLSDGFSFGFEKERALDAMDLDGGNANGQVSWAEAFNVLVVGQLAHFLDSTTIGDEDSDGDTDAADVGEALADYLNFDFFVPDVVADFFDISLGTATNVSSGADLKVDVPLSLSLTRADRIDLGYEADQLQIVIDPDEDEPTTVPVSASVHFSSLMFGFNRAMDGDVSAFGSDFIFAAPGADAIRIGASIGEPGSPEIVDFSVNVGFLGAAVDDGEITLDMDALSTASDPSNPDEIGFSLAQQGDASSSGVVTADQAPDDFDLDSDVVFSLRVGTASFSPVVEVTVDEGQRADLAELLGDIDQALTDANADLGALITVSDDGSGKVRLSLGAHDPAPLGFAAESSVPSGFLTAANAPSILGSTEVQVITFVLSVGGAVPRRVQVSTTPGDDDNDSDGTDGDLSLTGLVADLQAALDARFGGGTVTAGSSGGKIRLSAGVSLEITKTLTLDTVEEITQAELADGEVFSARADDDASYTVDLTVVASPGLNKPDDTPFNEDGTIRLDLDPFDQDDDLAVASDFTVVTVDSADADVKRLTFTLEDSGGLDLADPGAGSDMQPLLDFNVINTAQMLGLISQVGAWFDRLAVTDLLAEFEVPFADATLGELLSFKDLVDDTLLIDDLDNGAKAETDDTGRLLDWVEVEDDQFELQPQFGNAQQLAKRLEEILVDLEIWADEDEARAEIDATYDPLTRDLTYNLKLRHDLLPEPETPSDDANVVTVPLDFRLDLGAVTNVVTSGKVEISASGEFNWVMGVTLGNAAQALTPESLLSEVNGGAGLTVNDNPALTSFGEVDALVGRLSAPAEFTITIWRGGSDPDQVEVIRIEKTDTDSNTQIQHLAQDIDSALAAKGISGVDATHDGERIILAATDATITRFQVTSSSGNTAFTELGLQPEAASTVSLIAPATVRNLNPGDITFDIVVYRDGVADPVAHVTVSGTAGNATITDLVADVNAGLQAAGLTDIVASRTGSRLVLSAVGADIDSFAITPTGDTSKADAIGLNLTTAKNQLKDIGVDAASADAMSALVAAIALRAEEAPDSPFGRLRDATTEFTITAGALSDTISIAKSSTDANASVTDLVKDVNAAINASATLKGKLVAENDAQHLRLRALDPTITEIEVSGLSATEAEDLGLSNGQEVERALAVIANKAAPVSYGVTSTTTFTVSVSYDGVPDPVVKPVTIFADTTIKNRTLYDLVATINSALNTAFAGAINNPLVATVQAGQIVIGLKTGTGVGTNLIGNKAPVSADVVGFSISAADGPAATQLKLVPTGGGTNTADHADFIVSLSDTGTGANGVYRVTLDDATFDDDDDGGAVTPEVKLVGADHKLNPNATIADLIEAIEEDVAGHITVTLSPDGTSLLVFDETFASADREFSIQMVNGSPVALQLGIFASDTTQLDIGQFDVNDNGNPDGLIEGARIAVVDLLDRFFIGQGSEDILTAEVSVSTDGFGADATFGFVAITLTSPAQDLYEADFGLGLQESRATLGELFAALGDLSSLREKVADPSFEANSQSFTLDVDLKPGFDALAIPTGAQFTFNLDGQLGTFVNVAIGTATLSFDDSGSADTITRNAGSWLDEGFAIGQTIAVSGSASNDGTYLVAEVSEFVLTLAPGSDLTDESGVGGVTVVAPDELLFVPDSFVPDEVDIGDLANFTEIDFDHVITALGQIADFLQRFDAFEFLTTELPLLGVSIDELLDIADRFQQALTDVQQNRAGGVQLLRQKIAEAFGLPTDPAEITALLDNLGIPDPSAALIDFALKDFDGGVAGNDFLRFDLRLPVGFSRGMSVDLDLGEVDFLGGALPVDIQGGAGLAVRGFLDARLAFGIDLNDPSQIYLFDEATHVAGSLSASADNLTFNAAIGPMGAFVRDGNVQLGIDVALEKGTFDPTSDSKVLIDDIGDVFDGFTPALSGEIKATLPVFFPSEFEFLGDIVFDMSGSNAIVLNGDTLDIPDLADVLTLPDFSAIDLSSLDPFGSIPLMLDALDFFLQGLQDTLDGQVFGIELPFIGDQLAAGADFIEDLREDVLAPIRQYVEQAPELGQELIRALLFSLLGDGSENVDVAGQDLSDFLGIPDFDGLGLLVDYAQGAAGAAPTIDDIVLVTEDTDTDGTDDDYLWKFRLGQTFTPPVDVKFDLGFPGLALDMNAKLDVDFTWDLAMGLGIGRADGAYVFIGSQRTPGDQHHEELVLSVDVALIQPGNEPVLHGELGFLQLDIEQSSSDDPGLEQDDTHFHADFFVDLVNGSAGGDEKLSFSELGGLGAHVGFNADAEVNLEVTAKFNEALLPDAISALLPSISTRFVLDWEADGELSGDFEIGNSLELVAFRDVTISMGSFLSDFLGPVIEKIQEVTEPLQPIIDVITARIPVISDLAGKTITLVDIAGMFGYVEPAMIYAIADIIDLVNTIDGASGELNYNLGSFALIDLTSQDDGDWIGVDFGKNLVNPNFNLSADSGAFSLDSFLGDNNFALEDIGDFIGALGSAPSTGNVKQITTGLLSGSQAGSSGFAFPIFEDPGQMLGLLFGRDVALVTYDLAPFGMDFTYTQKFPIWGPLFGRITGSAGLTIDLAFGYDTFGVRQFAEGGFENPLDLLGGFFVSDTDLPSGTGGTDVPELVLKGELFAGAELNLGVASAGAEGGIILTVNFDLYDPDDDGRVRVDELLGNFLYEFKNGNPLLAPLAIFDVTGDVAAQLRAFIEVLFITKHFEITPPITLVEFSIDFEREPILGNERGDGTLLLNAGPSATQRLNGDIRDIDEEIWVKAVSDSEVLVWGMGVDQGGAQSYKLGDDRTIVWFGGEGDDKIHLDLSAGAGIRFELDGGAGDDLIEFTAGGAGGGSIAGGLGNDTITGGTGADVITGGEGNDTLDGGDGADVIFGDTGTLTVDDKGNDDPSDDVYLRVRSLVGAKDGADAIDGGGHDDIIFGGGNIDTINGNDGADLILGDGGNFEFVNGGVPVADGRVDLSAISARGAGAKDFIYGNAGNDAILGGAGDDRVDGGAGEDQIDGGVGFDIIYGGSAGDRIFGGDNDDIIFGDADPEEATGFARDAGDLGADGDDHIEGQEGNDYLRGNGGVDTIHGNRGADIIFGDTGNDVLFGEDGPDIMFGGADDDTMQAGDAGDIVFGDDGLVVYLDFHEIPITPFTATGSLIRTDASGAHKLIGDGAEALIGGFEAHDDGLALTMDLMVTESLASDGSDIITGGDSRDIIFGGGGALDTIFGDFDPAAPVSGPRPSGQDLIIGDGGRVEQLTRRFDLAQAVSGSFDGVDHISGNDSGDYIFGGGAADVIYGFENAAAFNHALLDGVTDHDVILGDNGIIEFNSGETKNRIEKIYTTAVMVDSGASDTVFGNFDNDVILGGLNSSADVLSGDDGDDVILGDQGELRFDSDADLDTLDFIRSYRDGLGGGDEISGDAGNDVLIGGTAGDVMYGDDATASNGAADGEDIMLGDNAELVLLGTSGRLKVKVAAMPAGSAVDLIRTTDDVDLGDANFDTQAEVEAVGGADTMSGSAKADIMLGGVNNGGEDNLYGDIDTPTGDTIDNDADDIMLGDNGLLDFTFGSDTDRNTLDLIRSYEDALGGKDIMSGNKGADVAIGGSAGDEIYGDDAGATAAADDLGDMLLGDNADVFLVAPGNDQGDDLKLVLDVAVFLIRTTDEEHDAVLNRTGGSDTISGNAGDDIVAGGVEGDTLYGDRATPTLTTSGNDGNDVILGDNAAFEWLSSGRLLEIEGISIQENNLALFNKYDGDVADTDLGTLDLITTEQPNNGGRDTIFGDEGDDLMFGGTDLDWMWGDDGDENAELLWAPGEIRNRDVMFGDHGRLYPQFSTLSNFNSRNFFAIDTGNGDGGEGDIMHGEEGDDVMLGQQGDDRMWGGSHADDMIGGHNVAGGIDELTGGAVNAAADPGPDNTNDVMDGDSGNDAMKGDNVIVWRRGDDHSPRFQTLTGAQLYTTGPDTIAANITGGQSSDPAGTVGRDVEVVDHSDSVEAADDGRFGDDLMAGGADDDFMLGDLGNDVMQGDGSIDETDDGGPNTITVEHSDSGMPDTTGTLYFNVPELASDGDDYIEGSGGDDLIYGGLGQDDIIGGSSNLFGLTTNEERPDGSDIIFGGAGNPARLARNDFVGIGDTAKGTADGVGAVPLNDEDLVNGIRLIDRHSRDADFIMGDNANIFRIVDGPGDNAAYRQYNYDQSSSFEVRGSERIVVRAMEQLDYTLGGADYTQGTYSSQGVANADNGLADLIHGESGDDSIFGMTGSDVLFGESDDDDIVGGYGNDWISGGTGQDGVLGDDGLLYTSRNSTLGEPLYGVAGLLATDAMPKYNNGNALNETISTPGDMQFALINVEGELKKSADLVPFSFDPGWEGLDDEFPDDQTNTPFADDIIFGGLGSDFLHGGSGDDAISGAEALPEAYVPLFDNGVLVGKLNLGYNAFDLPAPIEPGDFNGVALNPGDVLAYNPVDLDGQHLNNRFRAGEFFLYDEYDPLRRVQLASDGRLWKPDAGMGNPFNWLLNFDQTEGIWRSSGVVPKATGQQTESYPVVQDDGKDAIFGDLGNDWLVGGTGRDDMYGGWGNDLINADDDQTTLGDAPKKGDPQVPGANDRPDTHPFYEDRAYGGAGRDVLVANTGGDRLIDWVGEYNSFLVPFAPFGQATVSRTLMPHLQEFLYALSAGDGADFTRFADAVGGTPPAPTNNDPIPTRNGEPFGELGMVLQKDFAWGDQTGAPADPQAGNIPGGPRDVLRSANFQEGNGLDAFFVDTGKFSVQNGVLSVAADSTYGDAIAVYHVGDALPGYFEFQASVSVVKPTGGWKANAYLIFDYVDDADFKFAGIDVSSNKLIIGHRASWGWAIDKQVPFQAKQDISYNLLLAVNGVNATVVIDNKASVSYTFQPRMTDGMAFGLNYGLLGVGSDSARGTYDNVKVLVLPPQVTFQNTEDFADGAAQLMPATAASGSWQIAGGRYTATGPASSLIDLGIGGLQLNSMLDLSARLNTAGRAGFVFDRYDADDYKFVAIDAVSDQVIIGHYHQGGVVNDAVLSKPIDAGTDYTLGVVLQGSKVSVSLNGQAVLSKVYNAVVVDGDFGLLAVSGQASYDDVKVKTNDPAFVQQSGGNLLAGEGAATSASASTLTQAELDAATLTAMSRWTETLGEGDERLAGFGGVRITFADLAGDALGRAEGQSIWIDANAAGHGWSGYGGAADLVTVVTHELGHVLGFDHDDGHDVMAARLDLRQDAPAPLAEPAAPRPRFDLDSGLGATQPIEWRAWDAGWAPAYSPFGASRQEQGQGQGANFADFLMTLAARPAQADFDKLGKALGAKAGVKAPAKRV